MPLILRTTLAAAVLTILGVALLGAGAAVAAELYQNGLSVEVNVEPHPGQPGAYRCTAKIFDLETGEVFFAPRMTFRAGSPASVQSGFKAEDGDGSSVKGFFGMEISVSEDQTSVRYNSRLLVAGEVVNEQVFNFRLPEQPVTGTTLETVPCALHTVLKSLSYADAGQVSTVLRDRNGVLSDRGTVQVDSRTNTLIIREIPGNMITVLAMIESLDSPKPQ